MKALGPTLLGCLVVFWVPAVAVLLSGCAGAEVPDPLDPGQFCEAAQTLVSAREDFKAVLTFVDDAAAKVEATQALLDAALAAKDAYDSERYSDAVASAAEALRLLDELGADVPPEVLKQFGRAEALLTMAGR